MPLNADDLRNFEPASIMRLAKVQGLDVIGKTLEEVVSVLLQSGVADRIAQASDLDEQFAQSPQVGRDCEAIPSQDRPSQIYAARHEEHDATEQPLTPDSHQAPGASLEATGGTAIVCRSDASTTEAQHLARHDSEASMYSGPGTIYDVPSTQRPATPLRTAKGLYKGPGTIYSPRKSPHRRSGRITKKSRKHLFNTAPPPDPLEYLVPRAPSPGPPPPPPADQDTTEPPAPVPAPPEEPFADADLSLVPPSEPLVYTSLSAVYALHHLDDRDLQAAAVLANLKPHPSPAHASTSQAPPAQTQSQSRSLHAGPSRAKTPPQSEREREYAIKRARTKQLYHQLRDDAAQARRMGNVRAFAELRGDWHLPRRQQVQQPEREAELAWPARPGLQLRPALAEGGRALEAGGSRGEGGARIVGWKAGEVPPASAAEDAASGDDPEESDEEVDQLDPSSDEDTPTTEEPQRAHPQEVPISHTVRSRKRNIQDTRDGESSPEVPLRRLAHPTAPKPVIPSRAPPEPVRAPPPGFPVSHVRTILPAPAPVRTGAVAKPSPPTHAPTFEPRRALAPGPTPIPTSAPTPAPALAPTPTPAPPAPPTAATLPKRGAGQRMIAGTLYSAYGPPVAGATLAALHPRHARPHARKHGQHTRNVAGPYVLVDERGVRRAVRYVRNCGTYIEVWEGPPGVEAVEEEEGKGEEKGERGRKRGKDC